MLLQKKLVILDLDRRKAGSRQFAGIIASQLCGKATDSPLFGRRLFGIADAHKLYKEKVGRGKFFYQNDLNLARVLRDYIAQQPQITSRDVLLLNLDVRQTQDSSATEFGVYSNRLPFGFAIYNAMYGRAGAWLDYQGQNRHFPVRPLRETNPLNLVGAPAVSIRITYKKTAMLDTIQAIIEAAKGAAEGIIAYFKIELRAASREIEKRLKQQHELS